MEADLRTIILKCQAGDCSGFGGLYDAHVRRIYNFIYYKTHHKPTAEDLTSEVFMKALERIRQYDAKRPFHSWLYGIAQNAVIDHYRKLRPGISVDDAWDLSSGEDIARDADTRLKLEQVRAAVAKLPSVQRDVVIMRVWQEMSYREIAEVIGKSEDNCKVIFSRALKELKIAVPVALFFLLLGNFH